MENSSGIWLITAIEQFLHFVNCDVRTLFSLQLFSCCSAHGYKEHAASQKSCSLAVPPHMAIKTFAHARLENMPRARTAVLQLLFSTQLKREHAPRPGMLWLQLRPFWHWKTRSLPAWRIDRTAEQPFTASLPAFFDSLHDIEESAWHRLYGYLPDSLPNSRTASNFILLSAFHYTANFS